MLLLLTIADVRAVGSEVWTSWKALLFQELYEKAFNVLERGDFHLEASSERVKAVIKRITEMLEEEFPSARVREELKGMPVRLLLSNNLPMIAGYARMLLGLEETGVLMEVTHETASGYSDFTICTHDMPGLFSRITGVMAANGVNILGAQINTSRNGKVLDILQVNSPQGMLITDQQRWQKVESDMRRAIQGEVRVNDLVARRQRPTLLTSRPAPRFATRVEIDNEVSTDYTVIDIYTHDKVGLLYLITSTLTRLGLYIGVSKISTKVDQVADVFYVRDIFGQKIMADDKLAELTTQLKTAIDEWV
jgi:[protein-PII] uridylyltransferase